MIKLISYFLDKLSADIVINSASVLKFFPAGK
jgi:hypothetical protein